MSFKLIKGQQAAIKILQEALRKKHLEGSYLFLGPEGLGKKFVAKTLAKAANCSESQDDACGGCRSCLKIENGQHPDVHIIDLGLTESIKIEDVRLLQRDVSLRPYEGKIKVFILDNAHNLTSEASNALLKTLEEPSQNTLIILITSKPQLLFKTIVSRCKIIRFYPLKRQALEKILEDDYSLDAKTAHLLSYFSEGRMGSALGLKEKDFSLQRSQIINNLVSTRDLGLDSFSRKNTEELRAYLNILASWFRDIYLLKIGTPHSELINADYKTELMQFMGRYTFFDLDEIFELLSDSILYLDQNINIKLLVSNLKGALKK